MDYYKQLKSLPVLASDVLQHITITQSKEAYVKSINRGEQHQLCQLLNVDLSKCDTYNIMLVYFPPGTAINIHSDKPITGPVDKVNKAVFVPLTSCDKLQWSWWECIDDRYIRDFSSPDWKTVPVLEHRGAKLVKSVICNKPFITDISSWHSLVNKGDDAAIGISIRLMPWSWERTSMDDMPPINGLELL